MAGQECSIELRKHICALMGSRILGGRRRGSECFCVVGGGEIQELGNGG